MNSCSKLANKFAMKLGLESRPASSVLPSDSLSDLSSDFSSDFMEEYEDLLPSQNLNVRKNDSLYKILESARVELHSLTQALSLGDFESSLEFISNAKSDLTKLEELIKNQIK